MRNVGISRSENFNEIDGMFVKVRDHRDSHVSDDVVKVTGRHEHKTAFVRQDNAERSTITKVHRAFVHCEIKRPVPDLQDGGVSPSSKDLVKRTGE
jgi:hypothetical protein